MPRILMIVVFICLVAIPNLHVIAAEVETIAQNILKDTGVSGGIIVHLGCGDGWLTKALLADTRYVVHGLDRNPENVARAREYIHSQQRYGVVSVDILEAARLPYVDNLVNLVVVSDLLGIDMDEVMRVLAPGGVAYIKSQGNWKKTVKAWPKEIDEWSHYLHAADGNPVAQDSVVGPPEHYQWICEPLWMRSHESDSSVKAMVTAAGRLFYIVDDAPASLLGPHDLPDKWSLTVRDAFNGVLLWKVPIKDWGWRAWKPSWFTPRPGGIPLNMPKRLVADENAVYITLGYHAPVTKLDAKTGSVIKVYDKSEQTSEILLHDGVLVLSVLKDDCIQVAAINSESGDYLWRSEETYGGTKTDYYRFTAMHGSVEPAKVDPTLNTATDGNVVALLDGGDIVCLDFKKGKEKWRKQFPLVKADYNAGRINAGKTLWVGTLIISDGVVIHASPNQMAAFSVDSGRILWQQPKRYLQHLWFEWKDVFVIDGLVWTWSADVERGALVGSTQKSMWPVSVNGYDLRTGELKKKVDLGNIFKTHHHHRCYRNKATTRYILASRRGTEFVDLLKGEHTVHNWVRGICHLGMMPANGLQYIPPHPCECYIEEKLKGFNALAAAKPSDRNWNESNNEGLLKRGPAFGKTDGPKVSDEDWTTFRCDSLRSGSAKTTVPSQLRSLWRCNLGERIGACIAVNDHIFIPLIDAHQVVALDSLDGNERWRFWAGARIDTPPTYHKGTVLFGSADGWVYCLRADNGQLIWKFRGSHCDRRIGAFGQLESTWPVHGSVLVLDDVVYFVVGRSSQLDGGMWVYGLDAATGSLRHRTKLQGPDYGVEGLAQNYQLPMGALPDVLQSDGKLIFMRHLAFDAKLAKVKPGSANARRLRTKAGLLDDSYFKRVPWSFGAKNSYARMITHDSERAYFVRMFETLRGLDPKVYFVPGKAGYHFFATDNESGQTAWNRKIPLRANAMVVTTDRILLAGAPDVVDPNDPLGAFEDRKGGLLYVCDKDSGQKIQEYKLDSTPVFNGLTVASQRVFVSMQNGTLTCFGD